MAEALYPKTKGKQKEWLTKNCHKLKHEEGVAGDLLNQMKQLKQEKSHSKNITEKLQVAITDYENHQHQINYSQYREKKYPIGPGVAECGKKRNGDRS